METTTDPPVARIEWAERAAGHVVRYFEPEELAEARRCLSGRD